MALADIVTVCMDGSCDEKTIQDAIDRCGEGDRIEVYGGEYSGINIITDNLSLIGIKAASRSPVIRGEGLKLKDIDYLLPPERETQKAAVNIQGKNVALKGFEIVDYAPRNDASYGVAITSNGNIIRDNIISNFENCGIIICGSSNNTIFRNTISNNVKGISLLNSFRNNITDNVLFDNGININLNSGCESNLISLNDASRASGQSNVRDLNGFNKWDRNYYDNYVCDQNDTGCCDNECRIPPGHTVDKHPLTKNDSSKTLVICSEIKLACSSCIPVDHCQININASANRSCADVGDAIEYSIEILNEGPDLTEVKTYCEEINFNESKNGLKTCECKTYKEVYTIKERDLPGPFEIIFHTIGKNEMCFNRSKSKVLVNLNCANISVNKIANVSEVCPWEPIAFDINVTNTGNFTLDRVTIVDTLPDGMEYVNSTPEGRPEGRNISWNLTEPLPANKSNHINLVARITQPSPGNLTNTVNATARHQNDTVTSYDNETVKVILCGANISVNKTANASELCPWEPIAFDINVTNTGNVTLDQVTVMDILPDGMEYVNSTPEGMRKGRNISWNLTEPLPANKSNHANLVARITQPSPGNLTNTVNATARHQNDTVTSYDNETVKVIPCDPNISIEKSVSPSSGYPQSIVKFIIKVANTGNQPLNPVIVKDALPKGLNLVDSTPEGIKDGQNISWILPQLDPGKSEYIKLLAQIDMFASGTLQNLVNVIGRTPNGTNVTDVDSEPVEVIGCESPRCGSACWNCCNDCCKYPGNITNNINLNNSAQGIQVVSIGSGDVCNLSQESKSLVE
ncbi:MAG: DUF7507 domain-containing protein [Methanothrix sp.]